MPTTSSVLERLDRGSRSPRCRCCPGAPGSPRRCRATSARPGTLPQLRLAEVADRPRDHRREDERVEHRVVVPGDDEPARRAARAPAHAPRRGRRPGPPASARAGRSRSSIARTHGGKRRQRVVRGMAEHDLHVPERPYREAGLAVGEVEASRSAGSARRSRARGSARRFAAHVLRATPAACARSRTRSPRRR